MKISILLSIHNDKETLKKCIESIANQTYTNYEIIAVDDASTDGSLKLLNDLLENTLNKKIILSNKTNIGLTKSLNIGLKNCSGEAIARLDADDWWDKDKLKEQVKFLQNNPEYGYIGCLYANHFQSNGNQKKEKIPIDDASIRKYKFKRNPFAHSALFIKKELLDALEGYDETIRYGQDYNLFMRALPLTKFYNLPKVLCHRLVKKNSISIQNQKEQAKQSIQTRIIFMKRYGVSFWERWYLIEPLFNAYTPEWIKKLKRSIL